LFVWASPGTAVICSSNCGSATLSIWRLFKSEGDVFGVSPYRYPLCAHPWLCCVARQPHHAEGQIICDLSNMTCVGSGSTFLATGDIVFAVAMSARRCLLSDSSPWLFDRLPHRHAVRRASHPDMGPNGLWKDRSSSPIISIGCRKSYVPKELSVNRLIYRGSRQNRLPVEREPTEKRKHC
jgi:hypothetical protein